MKQSQRKMAVLGSLVGILTLTSALLLALAPPPLASEPAYDNLWAADGADSGAGGGELLNAVFQTRVPAQQGHWKYIYVHQSAAASGDAVGRGDHFVIGNGLGLGDGEIQMTQRWNNQAAATAPAGAQSIDPDCVSICLIGNFDTAAPSARQLRRVTQLVSVLQGQLGLGGDKVFLMKDTSGSAGIGTRFPVADLREQLLP